MNMLWNSAIALLVVTGLLLGLSLPFGKLAGAAGVSPVVWAWLMSAGAGSVLLVALLLRSGIPHLDAHKLRYYFVAGAISFAIPNVLMFSTMPHLGAGYVGIMFTLSPMITLMLSLIFGIRKPNALGMAGIAVGFVGAVLVAATRGEAGQPASLGWVLAGLMIPVCLATGNTYRTWDWPKNASSIELASGSHLGSAVLLSVAIIAIGALGNLSTLADVPLISLLQVASAASMFVFFFRLQEVGGPVCLSQIGYVGAAVGLIAGTVFLGESYGLLTWLGAFVIAIGVALTTKAQSGA